MRRPTSLKRSPSDVSVCVPPCRIPFRSPTPGPRCSTTPLENHRCRIRRRALLYDLQLADCAGVQSVLEQVRSCRTSHADGRRETSTQDNPPPVAPYILIKPLKPGLEKFSGIGTAPGCFVWDVKFSATKHIPWAENRNVDIRSRENQVRNIESLETGSIEVRFDMMTDQPGLSVDRWRSCACSLEPKEKGTGFGC